MNDVKLKIIQGKTEENKMPIIERPTKNYIERFCSSSVKNFIETGTYEGATSLRMADYGFKFIRSVDLYDFLSEDTKEKVKKLNEKIDIKFELGESPEKISEFFKEIRSFDPYGEIVFWLDAHASGPIKGGKYGGTPLLEELKEIAKDGVKTHTIFIDDRRLFGSSEWSFVKEKDCIELLMSINPNYKIYHVDGHEKEDIIVASTYDNLILE